GGQHRVTVLDIGCLGEVGTGAGVAAVAAVEDDHLVIGRGIICVGHDVSQRETVVPLGAVTGAQEPAGAVDVPVAGKVEKRDRGGVEEQLHEGRTTHTARDSYN